LLADVRTDEPGSAGHEDMGHGGDCTRSTRAEDRRE
jgi:hypothetical protein